MSCSDSRVPLEIIFEQGLGDLFIVRVAGNIIDVKLVVEKLKKSEPVISKLAREDLKILGGFYNIDSGRVDILE